MRVNNNNLEQKNIQRENTAFNVNNVNNVNNQIQRINTNVQKPVKNVYDNIFYNFDNGSLSADKKRVSNNFYTKIKKPTKHISENNINSYNNCINSPVTWKSNVGDCNVSGQGGSGLGFYCAARIMENGWKMDY